MHIELSPMRRNDRLSLHRAGDTLTISGEALNLSSIPDGATLLREAVSSDWLVSGIERTDGNPHLMLILPHGAEAPEETPFPALLMLTEMARSSCLLISWRSPMQIDLSQLITAKQKAHRIWPLAAPP